MEFQSVVKSIIGKFYKISNGAGGIVVKKFEHHRALACFNSRFFHLYYFMKLFYESH